MSKTGLVSISFRKHTTKEILEACKKAGLSLIEWGSDVHAPVGDIECARELYRLGEEYGVRCASYGTYFRLGVTPISELDSYIETAKALGTDVLRLWCGDKNYEDYSDAERDELVEVCTRAAKIAENAGVTLCLECHNNTYTNRLCGALYLMERVNSSAFRMYWQPNQYRTLEENLEYAEKIAKYTLHIHVFNWEGDKKYPLADGACVWKAYLEKFEGEHALLLEFMPDGEISSLNREAEALRRIIE